MKGIIKGLALLTAALMLTALCACGGSEKENATEATEAEAMGTIILAPAVDSYQKIDADTLNVVRSVLETRLEGQEIKNYTVTVDADKTQVTVTLPEKDNTKDVRELMTVQGELTFCAPDGTVLMDGSAVKEATANINAANNSDDPEEREDGEYIVCLELTYEGTEKFAEITKEYINQEISVCLDGEILTRPKVQAPITDGSAYISGDFTAEEVTRIANLINASPLPFPMEIVGGTDNGGGKA